MPEVGVTINGRNYQIACDDGQEEHLAHLAAYVDKRVQELVAAMGQVGDSRLLVMASLLVADELSEAYASLQKRGVDNDGELGPGPVSVDNASMVSALESVAQRIEGIAAGLERS